MRNRVRSEQRLPTTTISLDVIFSFECLPRTEMGKGNAIYLRKNIHFLLCQDTKISDSWVLGCQDSS